MGLLRRLFKGKNERKEPKEHRDILEELCGEDVALYEALSTTLLLNPEEAVNEGINNIVKRARLFERKRDFVKARIEYSLAIGVAMYEGKPNLVRRFSKKCAEIDKNYKFRKNFEFLAVKENAEKAAKIAKEYYAQTTPSLS